MKGKCFPEGIMALKHQLEQEKANQRSVCLLWTKGVGVPTSSSLIAVNDAVHHVWDLSGSTVCQGVTISILRKACAASPKCLTWGFHWFVTPFYPTHAPWSSILTCYHRLLITRSSNIKVSSSSMGQIKNLTCRWSRSYSNFSWAVHHCLNQISWQSVQ